MTPDQQRFKSVLEGISRGSAADIKVFLASLRPSEAVGELEANLPENRRIIWGSPVGCTYKLKSDLARFFTATYWPATVMVSSSMLGARMLPRVSISSAKATMFSSMSFKLPAKVNSATG